METTVRDLLPHLSPETRKSTLSHINACVAACTSLSGDPAEAIQGAALALAEAAEFIACGTPIHPGSDVAWAIINAAKSLRPKTGTSYPAKPNDPDRNTPKAHDRLNLYTFKLHGLNRIGHAYGEHEEAAKHALWTNMQDSDKEFLIGTECTNVEFWQNRK